MKKSSFIVLLAFVFASLFFTACIPGKKDNKLDEKTQQFNKDANMVKAEGDQIDNDINNALNDIPSMGGRKDGIESSPLCGCTIDSSQLANKILFFNFDGITLAKAMKKTFASRATSIPSQPFAFADELKSDPAKTTQWRGFIRKTRMDNAPSEFSAVVDYITVFLGPVAGALSSGKPFDGRWTAPGPWRISKTER